ncbi:MAG TPA: YcaO-like family protein, partial [Candidatus Angelobacter sp.]
RAYCKLNAAWWHNGLSQEYPLRNNQEIEALVDSEAVRNFARIDSLRPVHLCCAPCRDVHIFVADIFRQSLNGEKSRYARALGADSSFSVAKIKAAMEALEILAIERPEDATIIGSYSKFKDSAVYPPALLLFSEQEQSTSSFPFVRYSDDLAVEWVCGYDLCGRTPVLVPMDCVFTCVESQQPLVRVDTTGGAAHIDLYQSVLHGLYEVIERDALMITWLCRMGGMRVDLHHEEGPLVDVFQAWAKEIRGECTAFEITTEVGIPTFVALIFSDSLGGSVAVGAGANLSRQKALEKSLLEALLCGLYRAGKAEPQAHDDQQSLTGPAREQDKDEFARKLSFLFMNVSRPGKACRGVPKTPEDELRSCVNLLRRQAKQVISVNCGNPELEQMGIYCTKTLITWMQPRFVEKSEPRRLGNPRLFSVPCYLGLRPNEQNDHFNIEMHPFV